MNAVPMGGFALVALTFIVTLTVHRTAAQFPGDGVILSGPVDRIVSHGQNTTFNCYARGDTVYWRINGSIASPPFTTYANKGLNITVDRQRASDPSTQLDTWNLTIRATASLATNNNTRIQCTALGWTLGQSANVLALLIIAGHPQRPAMQIQTVQNGSAFQITWQRPFTHAPYPILNYMLKVANQTSREERTLTLPPNEEDFSRVIRRVTDEVSYNVCHELEFSVTAENSLGMSEPVTLSRAFPIVPTEVDSTHIRTEIRFDTSAIPHLEINFQVPEICSFQTANYTIEILDNNGLVVVEIGPTPYTSGQTSQTVNVMSGLERNQNYTLQIIVQTKYGQTSPATHHFFTRFVTLPHPPQSIHVRHPDNGTRIELSWSTESLRFNYIIDYNISMVNQTSGDTQQWVITAPTDGQDRVIFLVPGGGVTATVCHELHFEVFSRNELGRSQTGTAVTTGYPIAMRAISQVAAVPGYREDGTPYIRIIFNIPETCSYQNITYMFVVSNENGEDVYTQGPVTVAGGPSRQESFQFQTTDNSLTRHSYAIAASIEGITGLANTTYNTTRESPPTTNTGGLKEGRNELVIITGASLGVAVLLCLLVAGGVAFIVILVCACRCNKRNKSFAEPKSKGRKKKAPKTLPPMAHNPIYEGPIYDSPGGDSLKSLINNNATPPPLIESPRYFIDNTPPSLPPPRKSSVSLKSPLPQISEHEMDQLKFSFDIEVPPCDAEYTVMSPVRSHSVNGKKTKPVEKEAAFTSVGKAAEGGRLPEDEYVTMSCK